jgi:O-antigen/teichoic acid export membrane protein
MANPVWLAYLPKALQKSLHGRNNLLLILNNSGWIFLDKLFRLGLTVAVGIWVARYLGPTQFGELAYVVAYIAFFQAVANLGLDGITVRDISQNKKETSKILGTVFIMRLLVGIFCWGTAIMIMVFLNGSQDRSVLLTILIGSVLVFQSADTVDLWFQSQSQSRRTVLAKATAYFISSGYKVALILSEAELTAFAAIFIFESTLAAIGLAIAYQRYPCEERWKAVAGMALNLIKESWAFILSGVSIMFYMRIDQIMIKEMLGSQQLGIYAAVLPLATLWQVIPVTLSASLAPFVARKKAESESAYWLALNKIFKVYAILGWLVILPTIILAHWLVPLLFGNQYQNGVLVLSIYVFTNIFINMGVAQGLWMLNERRPWISLMNTMAGAIVCVVGNYLIIPKFGIVGVSFVAVMAQMFSTVLSNLLFSRRIFFIQIRSIIWPFFSLKGTSVA